MRALIVGAGAVGQVFAHHLARGGADVAFFVKPKHLAEAAGDLPLFCWNTRRSVSFRAQGALTTPEAVAGGGFDHVFLTVSSTALRSGDWLGQLARAAPGATFVSLQPGLADVDVVARAVPGERIVLGLTAFLSYQAPLPTVTREPAPAAPHMAYWFPPLSKSELSGPTGATARVVGALRAGGLPARTISDARRAALVPNGVFTGLVSALELSGWSFRRLREDGPLLALALRAAREAIAVGADVCGVRPPSVPGLLLRPWVVKLLLRVAPLGVPFDLETYARVHFTKVGDQTPLAFETYQALGRARGLPAGALEALFAAVQAGREQAQPPAARSAGCNAAS